MENRFPVRFFVVTFLWTWFFWLIPVILNGIGIISVENWKSSGFGILMILGVFGPMMGAIISLQTINGKESIKKYFKSYLSLNFGWKAWLAIILFAVLCTFIPWIIPEFFGEERLQTVLPSIYVLPLYIIFIMFLGGGQEELGWRGYIMPFLEKKFGLIIGSLMLGVIWAIWHIPLWFIPGGNQVYMSFFGFVIFCIGGSYVYSWIIELSGNRLLSGIITHGAGNALWEFFPMVVNNTNSKQTRFWISCILIFITGIITVLIRTYRNKKYGT